MIKTYNTKNEDSKDHFKDALKEWRNRPTKKLKINDILENYKSNKKTTK